MGIRVFYKMIFENFGKKFKKGYKLIVIIFFDL